MAECPGEGLPPDIDPSAESDQTEADSEFIDHKSENCEKSQNAERNTGDKRPSQEAVNPTDPAEIELNVQSEECQERDENPEENVSELERTESTGSVRADLLTAENVDAADNLNVASDQQVNNAKSEQSADAQTPDSADDIQCLAEEDRDSITGTLSSQETQPSADNESDTKHSSQNNPSIHEEFSDTFGASALHLSENQDNWEEHASDIQIAPNVLEGNDNEFESEALNSKDETANSSDNVLEEDPSQKEAESALSEPDQPECDINSNRNDDESEQNVSQNSVHVNTVLTTSVTVETPSGSGASVGLAAASNIPRVSSQGEIGQIQSSVQALIDKTSGFLDSDPPSTMSSMSDLDQAGLDALSSVKLLDTVRLDTPSPRAQSPQQATNSTQPSTLPHSEALQQETESSTPLQSKTSQDISCLSANVNTCTERSDNVQIENKPSAQAADTDEDLLSQLDAELDTNNDESRSVGNNAESGDSENPNGLIQRNINLTQIPEYKKLLSECEMLRKQTDEQQQQIKSLQDKESHQTVQLEAIGKERDTLKSSLCSLQGKSTDEIYQAQVKEMEATIAQQTKELIQTKEKLSSHDAAAKRAVQTLQTELKKRVDEITKLYEETKKEKDAMVMKYAMSEQKSIEAADKMSKCEMRLRDIAKEREVMIQRFTQLKKNREGAIAALEARNKDVTGLKKEIEMLKEAIQTHEMKSKWAHNKLKAEELSHRETKSKLDELQRKLNEQREEALILRQDCQAMIKTYQESEEIKSSNLDHELKKKETELQVQMAAKNEVEEVHTMLRKELDSLKVKHKDMIAELKTYKDKVQCLETERRHQEKSLDAFKETLQSQKQNNETMKARLLELETVEEDMLSVKERNTRVMERNDELEQSNKDLQAEMDGCARREQEHLEFTQKISEKNSTLQSQNSTLEAKVKGLSAEVERLSSICENLEKKNAILEKELVEEKRQRKEEHESLSTKLAEKSRAAEQLAMEVEDQKDENKTLKRRHTGNVKDLTRQLQQTKKKLETYENKDSGKDSTSMGSRTSSTTSLETTNNQHGGVSKSPTEPSAPEMQEYPEVRVIEVDKQMLIEKIVKLQKAHARKNEKIEFMDDHINQLLEEVKKKAKIIQMYALREEGGTLVPESVDNNKAALAKKTGIMASLYSMHQQDGSMTLELSLEINRKLQAVLEDTLLKNITIKDNLETLGREIARLSQENRQLQLEIQALQKS